MNSKLRVSAIILRHNQVLLIHKRKDKSHQEHYVFPGGAVKAGETKLAAIRREIQKETSLSTAKIIAQKTYPDPTNRGFKHFLVVCEARESAAAAADQAADQPQKTAAPGLEWHNITDALKLKNLYPIPVKNYLRDLQHDARRS